MITLKADKITQLSYPSINLANEDCMKQQIQIKDMGDWNKISIDASALPLTLEFDVVVLWFL